jgi:hypothetical protein
MPLEIVRLTQAKIGRATMIVASSPATCSRNVEMVYGLSRPLGIQRSISASNTYPAANAHALSDMKASR